MCNVPPDAVLFPQPSRAEQRERLPKQHPRLFMRPEDLPRIQAAAIKSKEAADLFLALRKSADVIIQRGPTPEPKNRGSARDKEDAEAVKYWWPNRETAERASQEAELLAFMWLITREEKYSVSARVFLMALTSWDPDGPSNFAVNCEAGKALLYRPARAYDWAYDALTEEERVRFCKMWQRRVSDAWKSGEVRYGNGHLTQPFDSHGNRVWHKIAEVAIALYGEAPEAETWLDYAVNKFYACYPVWADDDGGWHEGASYLTSYMSKITTWMQVAHTALSIDGLKKPFFDQIGNFPLYLIPPNTPNSGFGDLSYVARSCGFLNYFARMQGANPANAVAASHWSWWLQQTRTGPPTGIEGFLYEVNLPALPAPHAPDTLPVSKLFRGTGIASLHLTLLDSREDVHLLFKASPFGTRSHNHNAQLGFQLNAFGDCLLPAITYRDLHGSKFHSQWCYTTRSQNAVLVNGAGQLVHSPLAEGKVVESNFNETWDYVRGEATAAYTGAVTRAERAIVFVKPDVLVIFDDFASTTPATFQFMLHGMSVFAIDEARQTLRTDTKNAGVIVHYLAPQKLRFTQTDGFSPAPKMRGSAKPFPNQWHVEAALREPVLESDTITVLVPFRAGQKMKTIWSAEREDTATASGVIIRRDGQKIGVAFRKKGKVAAEWDGARFDGPVWVTTR